MFTTKKPREHQEITKKASLEQQKERQLRETLRKINIQVIDERDQFEVDPETFAE